MADRDWMDFDDEAGGDLDWVERVETVIARKVERRGRPRGSSKKLISLRLDADVIDHFKKSGRGWQTRINALLRDSAGLSGRRAGDRPSFDSDETKLENAAETG